MTETANQETEINFNQTRPILLSSILCRGCAHYDIKNRPQDGDFVLCSEKCKFFLKAEGLFKSHLAGLFLGLKIELKAE